MTKHTPPPSGGDGERIIDEPLSEALSRRYLAYALSTITGRALLSMAVFVGRTRLIDNMILGEE